MAQLEHQSLFHMSSTLAISATKGACVSMRYSRCKAEIHRLFLDCFRTVITELTMSACHGQLLTHLTEDGEADRADKAYINSFLQGVIHVKGNFQQQQGLQQSLRNSKQPLLTLWQKQDALKSTPAQRDSHWFSMPFDCADCNEKTT